MRKKKVKVEPYSMDIKKAFPSELLVNMVVGDSQKRILRKSFEFRLIIDGLLQSIIVPEGFVTDFASIPRIFYTLVGPPWGKYGASAVIHDYLYSRGFKAFDRKVCDKVFLLGMKVLKVGFLKRQIMYTAVRVGGRKAYRQK